MTDVDATPDPFHDRAVLITGAGGAIGSGLARHVAARGPRSLTLLEQSEYPLFRIETELRERHPGIPVHAMLGDVTLASDVDAACACAHPDVVLHAAAYTHATMAERAIVAATRVNVLGTAVVQHAASRAGARMILVSPHQAAEPASVLGATRDFADRLVRAHGGTAAVLRTGDSLRLATADETPTTAEPPCDRAALATALDALRTAVAAGDAAGVLEALMDGVPDFIPAADTCARVLPAPTDIALAA